MIKTTVTNGHRGTELLWRFGTLTRAFDPKKDKRYGALYNYDLSLIDQKGPIGVMLQLDGDKTVYNVTASPDAPAGTWFLVQPVGSS